MPGAVRFAVLYARAARRAVQAGGGERLRERLRVPDERVVFVFGCPRSGTTFLARSLGSLDGFVDLGEVAPLKALLPELAGLPVEEAAPLLERVLDRTRRLGLVGARRAIEQTPETVFAAAAAARAFPEARLLHSVRDGRDVVCSLLERGWLSAGRGGRDDAGAGYGPEPRFWVEPERREEFARVSDARRAAWAWRRYVEAGVVVPGALELRYEQMAREPAVLAERLAPELGVDVRALAGVLAGAHADSVGRFERDLTAKQLRDVEDEAGELLARLGYV